MKYGAAFLTGIAAASIVDELLPGSHVVVFGDDMASIEARQAGLHFRDSVLVLSHGPRSELVSVFRKPLAEGTVAEQVIRTKTGGLHIDACRVGTSGSSGRWPPNLVLVHAPECVPGTARVDGHKGYPNGPGGSSAQFSQKGVKTTRTGAWKGHADADGKETVAAWSCVPECSRGALDALSGQLRARGNVTPTKRRQSDGVTGWGVGPDGETDSGDVGGASRFFPQFRNREAMYAWLKALLLPPGGLLFFR